MSSATGTRFRVTTFGESHGRAVGAVVDGCPARLALREADIQAQLDRRRPGGTALGSARREEDRVVLLSGVEDGLTLGGPIALMIENRDQRPGDYRDWRNVPRPSHADFTYQAKYGIRAASGGGRASARETVGRVAAGAIAETFLAERHGIEIVAWVAAVGPVEAPDLTQANVTRSLVDERPVRCPDADAAARMTAAVEAARAEGDSLGGIVTAVCRHVPAGWGEPVFGKMEACLAAAMLSIPAAKGFELGSGFQGARMRGSEHNDAFVAKGDTLGTATNRSGGVQGGITNGEPIVFRVAFKPTATISREQRTVDFDGKPVVLKAGGRHDPCVLPRAVPVVEGMAAIVLADAALLAGEPMGRDFGAR
ncbi:MAG: chorismate synthase [Kiritimatiellae bacterium]|nr:chorismate synthase [Kiritimatiellia bacterium]